MENNEISLSQSEVDKLLGLTSKSEEKPVQKKNYSTKKAFSDAGIEKIKGIAISYHDDFLKALKEKFGEPKIRKLSITAIDQICSEEFFDSVTSNDFLYKLNFEGKNLFIKLDPFLFGALSGMVIDPKHKINFFQSEVLRHFVVAILTKCIEEKNSLSSEIQIENLYEKSTKEYVNNKTGIMMTISWNENLRSLGVEKIFITPEFMKNIC